LQPRWVKNIALKKIFFGSENFKDVRMCIELYQFFMILGEHLLSAPFSLPPDIKPNHNRITERMISVCSYLSNHCTENISLESAADYAGFSKSHFSRMFKEFTANSYTDFITKERLRKAEELLTNSNLPITDAAFQSGFNSISTFNRIFKQYKHCSPSEFRDLYQSTHI
jgi:AraC-like DNA-binding protein